MSDDISARDDSFQIVPGGSDKELYTLDHKFNH